MKLLKVSILFTGIFFTWVVLRGMSSPFIKLELIKRHYSPLEEDDDSGWSIKYSSWKENLSNPVKVKYSNKEDLKSRCRALMFANFTGEDSEDYIEARDWCTKPASFLDKTASDNKKPISKEDIANWDKKVEVYKNSYVNTKPISMHKQGNKVLLRSDITVSKLRIWCSNKSEKYWTKDDAEYASYLEHCTL